MHGQNFHVGIGIHDRVYGSVKKLILCTDVTQRVMDDRIIVDLVSLERRFFTAGCRVFPAFLAFAGGLEKAPVLGAANRVFRVTA